MENNNDIKLCKKCKKPLPSNYNHKFCEACDSKRIFKAKDIAKKLELQLRW